LTNRSLAEKTIILIEKDLYKLVTTKTLAAKNWENMRGSIIEYRKRDPVNSVIKQVFNQTQKMRAAMYIEELHRGMANGH
jgi:hypothetical protein